MRADEIDRIVIGAERIIKERTGLAVTFERPAGCRERDCIGRMCMDNAVDVAAGFENLRMDVDLAVPARGASDDIALQIDGGRA